MAHVENDLARIKGIGPKYAELLDSIGVDSVKELRHRNPENLKEMIETRHGPVIGLPSARTGSTKPRRWTSDTGTYSFPNGRTAPSGRPGLRTRTQPPE